MSNKQPDTTKPPALKRKYGRAKSMIIIEKDGTTDVTAAYFNHPSWQMNCSDPTPSMPLDVQLELINRCNLSCEACPAGRISGPRQALSWKILERIVDQAAQGGVAYFTICGIGEAVLHPDLFRLLKYIRQQQVLPKGLRVLDMMPSVLISNAVWTESQVAECVENPPDLLSVSLAGLTNKEIIQRRSAINLERFKEVVSTIYQNRKVQRKIDGGVCPVIHISTHIYPSEFGRKEEIERFQEEWFPMCDAIVFKPTMPDLHLMDREKFLAAGHTGFGTDHYVRTAPCFETSRRLSIASNGEVWCGHHNFEDFGPRLGNVYVYSLKEIWDGEAMRRFRHQVRNGLFRRPNCRACGGEIRDREGDQPLAKT